MVGELTVQFASRGIRSTAFVVRVSVPECAGNGTPTTRRRAFTLIELLAVVSIFTILATYNAAC
jgi:prepilin-type N-terminal cleavage/methylation domain-containing protein